MKIALWIMAATAFCMFVGGCLLSVLAGLSGSTIVGGGVALGFVTGIIACAYFDCKDDIN